MKHIAINGLHALLLWGKSKNSTQKAMISPIDICQQNSMAYFPLKRS